MEAAVIKDSQKHAGDPASDIFQYQRHPLDTLFAPKAVAVVGATEKTHSVGRTVLWNLISTQFGGTVYPINPNRPSILGIKAYPQISDVPDPIDLAVIVTPAPTVPGIISDCVTAGVKSAIVISAGFKETGEAGAELERQILARAREGHLRIVGPNCLGIMNPHSGLNATFATTIARKGNVGFISQSGALGTAVLDWSLQENVGFSSFISLGSMLDVGWGDLIYYLGNDPRTESIVIYMESIGDARAFLSAAREVALTKPIIVIKAGRTEAAAKAAASHTGSLTGSDEVLDTAFRRVGVLRVSNIAELFNMADVLAKQPRPKGPHLTILTNAGGPGVLATDALIGSGGELTELSAETMSQLNALLPPHWSHNNPVDILGDADPQRYAKSLEIAANDPNSDGLLVILTPQAMTDPTATAAQLKPYAKTSSKPVLASWMGGADIAAGAAILNNANIPSFAYPDTAARTFTYMWRYSDNLRSLYETPAFVDTEMEHDSSALVQPIIDQARAEGRTILTEFESKRVLAAYGIPTVETRIAETAAEAEQHAAAIGYPVVLKLYSRTITHKTDVGGVQLNLKDGQAVRAAFKAIQDAVTAKVGAEHFNGVTVQPMIKLDGYEIILGSSIDSQFGPVLLFGSGGQLVEVYKDRALALPPLTTTLARRMMERTRIYHALKGVRGRPPVNLKELEQLLVRFSQLVVEQPLIKELDINPLLASPERLLALDARVVLHDPSIPREQLPRPAIRPYPTQYVAPYTLEDGSCVTIRPIRPEDEPLMVKFHERLSEQSVYQRYFHMLQLDQRIAHERLTRICFNDYDREMALVVERRRCDAPANGKPSESDVPGDRELLAVGRMSKLHGSNDAEFAVLVRDDVQRQMLGTELLKRLTLIARDEGITRLVADILPDNYGMKRVCEKLGFQLKYDFEEGVTKASYLIEPRSE